MLTLSQAAKTVGKSKPTVSKAIKDGKLSAQKVNGVYQIEPSELLRVFPAVNLENSLPPALTGFVADDENAVALALAQQQHSEHLTGTVDDLRTRLDEMKAELDIMRQEAREDRQRVVSLLEDRHPSSFWSKLLDK